MTTWNNLLLQAPELVDLEREAVAANRDGTDWFTYLSLHQGELRRLVGFAAQNPALRTTEAWQAALAHLATVWASGRTSRVLDPLIGALAPSSGRPIANHGATSSVMV